MTSDEIEQDYWRIVETGVPNVEVGVVFKRSGRDGGAYGRCSALLGRVCEWMCLYVREPDKAGWLLTMLGLCC